MNDIEIIKNICQDIPNELSTIRDCEEFYLEKAQKALTEWDEYQLKIDIDTLINDFNYKDFCDSNEPNITELRNLIFRLVAYCDEKAKDKERYNKYSNNRVVARCSIRQNAWAIQLIKYKKDPSNLASSIQNVFEYLKSPSTRFPIVSETHRRSISENLLNKKYEKDSFDKELIQLFKDNCDISVKNENNITYLYNNLLYKNYNLWANKTTVKGLMYRDSGNWKDELYQDIQDKQYGCIWWNSDPVKTGGNVLPQLEMRIASDGGFEIYIFEQGLASYKAHVCDFAHDNDYDTKKIEWKKFEPVWYSDNFRDYTDGKQSAKIVFLINDFEKLDKSLSIDKFIPYGNAQLPHMANMVAYTHILKPEDIAMKTFLDKAVSLLQKKKNIILQGAPGTGKTYNTASIAVSICEGDCLINPSRDEIMTKYEKLHSDGQISFCTFHQTMDYEDFIEGFKPTLNNNTIVYELKDGIFKAICDTALSNPSKNYAIIIDEINRGNVSKIFGELITLIEADKRYDGKGHNISSILTYSHVDFRIPNNLYIIGTMNTTDRSTGILDYALRRRFAFITVPANEEIVKSNANVSKALDIFRDVKDFILKHKTAEEDIDDLMIGHSYFMAKTDADLIENIEFEIIPLLIEYIKDGILQISINEAISYFDNWKKLTIMQTTNG